jgi:hypothetical protein
LLIIKGEKKMMFMKKVDPDCKKLYDNAVKKNPMAFAVGKWVKIDGKGVPLKGELEKFHLVVSDFRVPVENDCFVSYEGEIVKFDYTHVINKLDSGYRFIIKNWAPALLRNGDDFDEQNDSLGDPIKQDGKDDDDEETSTSTTEEIEELDPVASRLMKQKKSKALLFPTTVLEHRRAVIKLNCEDIPIKGELEKLGLKVTSYRVPTEKDVFISNDGEIVAMEDCFAFDYSTDHGLNRFILGVKTPVSTTKKTAERK